jgi:hypothetical protein
MLRDQLELLDRTPGGITFVPPGVAPAAFQDCQFGTFDDTPSKIVGDYFLKKYREQAQRSGVQATARNLKKQGVAPEIAVLILAVRP